MLNTSGPSFDGCEPLYKIFTLILAKISTLAFCYQTSFIAF